MQDEEAIATWLELLDRIDYYELLGIEREATADDVKHAFHAFAESFHPDGHPGRGSDEQRALDTIFKRGNEAYSILSSPSARAQYDAQLGLAEPSAPPRMRGVPPPSMRAGPSRAPAKLEDSVRTPSARPFARRGEELVEKGDLKQAKLQLVMANHMDPDNGALEAYLRHIEEELRRR